MAAQNFKEEDWGDGDTFRGRNWAKNFQACYSVDPLPLTFLSVQRRSFLKHNPLTRTQFDEITDEHSKFVSLDDVALFHRLRLN